MRPLKWASHPSTRPARGAGGRPARPPYGPREMLELGRSLTGFKDVEESVPRTLKLLGRWHPLASVALIETFHEPRMSLWHHPAATPARLEGIKRRALRGYRRLTGRDLAGVAASAVGGDFLSPKAPAEPGGRLLLPLAVAHHSIFGALQVESPLAFKEQEIAWFSAAAQSLSIILAAHESRLNERSLRRSAEARERQLRERTRELETAVRELEAFTYTVAHDLRAPLRAMHGFSQQLLAAEEEALSAAGRDRLRRIQAESRRMEELIQDLLSYTRLGRESVRLQGVELGAAVSRARESLAPDIERVGALVTVEDALPRVIAQESLLVLAVQNLLSNAVKFTAPGVRPRVRVRAEARGGRVRLWVEDNGIGIASEHHERVFGVFERLHPRGEYAGTGMGLAIVRKAAERMNGRAGVVSSRGEGSRFWVELQEARSDE